MAQSRSYLFVLSGVEYFGSVLVKKFDPASTTNPYDHMVSLCFSSTTPSGAIKNTFVTYRVSDKAFRDVWETIGGSKFTGIPKKAEVEYKVTELAATIPESKQYWIAWWHDNHIIKHEYNTIDSIKKNRSTRYVELWNDQKGFPPHYYEMKRKHEDKKAEKKEGVRKDISCQ